MRDRIVQTAFLLGILGGGAGCTSLMFWRDTQIMGKARLVDEKGAPAAEAKPAGISVNFINLAGKLDESVLSAQTDELGKYRSPKLVPGKYKVEAMLQGYAIQSATILVKNHQHKANDFILKRIREGKGRSLKESQEENIPSPGEVQIKPPR